MGRTVRCGLVQAANPLNDEGASLVEIRGAAEEKHAGFVAEAAKAGVKILCFQELFNGPYYPPSQDPKWYGMAEPVPGPTTERMAALSKAHGMVLVVPLTERAQRGVYYNTAAVLDADGTYLGKYRKNHLPHVAGFWEKFFFKPGNLGYPVFETAYAKVGVYLCYDRHFPEGARILGLNGAEIVFNPSATVAGLSRTLWKLEQPAHAAANGYFMGCINRVGVEPPWNIGRFYGTSYFVDPRGAVLAEGPEDRDALVTADLDLEAIDAARDLWQFYRDRRPETYEALSQLLP